MRVPHAFRPEFPFMRALIAAILALSLLGSHAHAAPSKVEELYEQGKAALAEQAPAVALGRFKDALKQAKGDEGWTWRLLLAVALAYQSKGEPEHAIEYYRRFLAQTDVHQATMTQKWKRRRAITGEQLVALEQEIEKTHGFVSVTTDPPGAEITVDGTRAGADRDAVTPFGLIIEPGKHSVLIKLSGYEPVEKMVNVKAGDSQPIRLKLVPSGPPAKAPGERLQKPAEAAATPSPPKKPEPKPETETETKPTEAQPEAQPEAPAPALAQVDAGVQASSSAAAPEEPIGPWVVIGTAAASAAAGVAMTVLAAKAATELETWEANNPGPGPGETLSDADGAALFAEFDERNSSVQTYELMGGILYGVALAAAAGGIVWMLLAEPDDASASGSQSATLVPELIIAPTTSGLSGHATWRF